MAEPRASSIAVIPARGGSKRIPRKNIRTFAGRPLIAWAIETCLESGLFESVFVSTDDDEIAEISIAEGARVPFRRPADLADDRATTARVMAHAAEATGALSSGVQLICCVYPAAVLITAGDLRSGRDLLESRPSIQYSGAVVRYAHPIQRAMDLSPEARIQLLHPEYASTRTQDLATRWHDAGQFYWGRTRAWADAVPYFSSALGVVLPSWRAQDIDDEDDWIRAEASFMALATQRGRDSGTLR